MDKTKRRELMNRINIWLMTISCLVLIISAIATHDREPMALHIVMAVIFTLALIKHLVTHRKAFMRYISGSKKVA